MSVNIGDALSEGLERTIARNGLLLAALFYAVSVPGAVISATLTRQMEAARAPMSAAPAVEFSPAVLGILTLLVSLVSAVVTVGAIRTFVGEDTEELAAEDFTDDIVVVLLNLIAGGIVFAVAVFVGTLLLIIPGLFLLTSLFFWNYYVVVEGDNFVDGLANSWSLTKGNRLELFALGVVVAVVNLLVNVAFGVPAIVLPDAAAFLLRQAGSTLANVFLLATASRTFVALTGGDHTRSAEPPRQHARE